MLAPQELKPIADYLPATEPVVVPEYDGFPWWFSLVIETGWERKAAEWLGSRVSIFAYWPHYTDQVRRRGRLHAPMLKSVIPGMLFVPRSFMEVPRRDEIRHLVHCFGLVAAAGRPAMLSKSDMEKIRDMEALNNLPLKPKNGVIFKVGQKVKFENDLYADFWGVGTVVDVASKTRIGVEVQKLFGRATKVYVPTSEIEVM